MNYLFAWRYFKATKSTNAINIIAWVSMSAIIVGTAALIIVLSVFNGFEDLVKSLYSTFYTDLKILPANGKTFTLTNAQLKQLQSFSEIKSYSLVAEDKALLQNGEFQSLVYIKGVDQNYTKVTKVTNHIVNGKFEVGTTDTPTVVLGAGVENALGLLSDRSILPLTVYLFKKGTTINVSDLLQSLSSANITPAGTFIIQQDFDNKYVITNLSFIQNMLGWQSNEYNGVEIALTNYSLAQQAQKKLQELLGRKYIVVTRYQQNQSLYAVMNVEKWAIYVVLSLILVVAAFNMIGSLTMLVMEKQKDIQVLKALGANDTKVQRIFLNEGLLLGLLGAAIGITIAILICWVQLKFKLIPLEGGTFIINYYPVKMRLADFGLVLLTVLIVTLFASWFPSKKAAIQPIELKS